MSSRHGLIALALAIGLWAKATVAQVPNWPATYQMNQSTILMVCNYSGYTDPQSTKGWTIVDFDWSNSRTEWAAAKPMDCEERLITQVPPKRRSSCPRRCQRSPLLDCARQRHPLSRPCRST